jgi:hypothetical protein
MKFYRQPIILFGFVLPIILAAIIGGGAYYAKSTVEATLQEREALMKTSKLTSMTIATLEKKNLAQRPHLERWTKLLALETANTMTTHLREIIESLPNKEIQQTSLDCTATKAGFGAATTQKSSQIRLALRGTYKTVQKALLELETRMPQLQLDDLKMDPNPQSALLNFQITYTAWES